MVTLAATEPRSLHGRLSLGLRVLSSNCQENVIAHTRTFDIADHDDAKRQSPATFNQCKGLAARWSKSSRTGAMDWVASKRIAACLFANSQAGQLSFEQAHKLFTRKTLPKVYAEQIRVYLAANVEVQG